MTPGVGQLPLARISSGIVSATAAEVRVRRVVDAAAAIALVGAGVALVVPALLAGGVLGRYPSDGLRQYYFVRDYLLTSLGEGRWPLWNPFTHFGTPFLANIQWAALYPLNLPFVPLPAAAAYNLFVGLHLGIAGGSMYALARTWHLQPAPALVASLAYAFSGTFLGYAWGGVNILSALAWQPLVLLFFDRGVAASRRRVLFVAGAIAVLALQILAGHPQFTFFTALLLLADAFAHVRAGEGDARRRGRLAPVAIWLVVVGAAVAIASVQFLPTYEAAQLSTRQFRWSLAWPAGPVEGSYNPVRLVTWLIPDLFGSAVSLPPAATDWLSLVLREAHSNEFRGYVGVLPLVLAAYSLTRWRREPRVRFLSAVAAASLVLALGHFTPVYGALYAIAPPLRTFRMPARFLSLAVFAIALLAGIGAQALLGKRDECRLRWARVLAGLSAVAFVAVLAGWLVRAQVLEMGRSLSAPVFQSRPSGRGLDAGQRQAMIESAYALSLAGTAVAGVLLASSALFLAASARDRRRAALLGASMVLVTALDLAVQAWPSTDYQMMESHLAGNRGLVEPLRTAGPPARAFVVPSAGFDSRPDPVRPSDNVFLHYRLLSAGGYDTFELSAYRTVLELIVADLRRGSGFLAELFGLTFVVSDRRLEPPAFVPVGRVESATVFETRYALPRAYLVPRARRVGDHEEALRILQARGVAVGSEVLVEGPVESLPAASSAPGRVEVVASAPEELTLQVSAAAPAWLVVNDSFYPGWVATVDGSPVPIARANGLVRAIQVQAGDHRVHMAFRPRSFRVGAWVSIASLAACAAMVMLVLVRERRTDD